MSELYHSGRKGMKWYQHIFTSYKDYTAAKKRKKEALAQKRNRFPKDVSDMSYDDVRKLVDRMELEKRYKSLLSELQPNKAAKVKQFVASFASQQLKTIAERYVRTKLDEYLPISSNNDNSGNNGQNSGGNSGGSSKKKKKKK